MNVSQTYGDQTLDRILGKETSTLSEYRKKRQHFFSRESSVGTFFDCSLPFYICVPHSYGLPCATADHDVCRKRCQTTVQSWTDAWGCSLRQRPSRCRSSRWQSSRRSRGGGPPGPSLGRADPERGRYEHGRSRVCGNLLH